MTRTPPELALSLQNSAPSQREDVWPPKYDLEDNSPTYTLGRINRWNVREDRILLNSSYCIGLALPTLSPARLQLECSENVDEGAVEQWINEDSKLECCEVFSDDDIVSRITCVSEETSNFEECPESDEEAVEQWINEDSKLERCEVLSDDDIVSRVTCVSEETRNFEECPESDEEAVEQWINEDSKLERCEVLSDDDILSRVTCVSEETSNFEECPEIDEENLVTHEKLSHGAALVHTEALLDYLELEDESTPEEKMILRNLRSIIRRRVNEKRNQTSIKAVR
ncbi:hypothetical protein AVEN_153859-1 [Araneus ventricosus]|uniref:Uncharacterized protein n=1 Tax=Araneus ventricosus TaxID=182803 RepID=A0A4Y2SQP4_ARAVE|nr:hypothetical protein AVEN_86663-1 [Araneus ventricosus]GBN90517.1 hypothetical protein AVEN_153859-1 [Araneus ventricosus]